MKSLKRNGIAFGRRLVCFLVLFSLFSQPFFSEDLLVSEEQLNTLEMTLTEQMTLIEKQEAQLKTLNTQLQKSNEEMMNAKTSLKTLEKETRKSKWIIGITTFSTGLLTGIIVPAVITGAKK